MPGRAPRRAGRARSSARSCPASSSRTSARTIERPVPSPLPFRPAPSSATASATSSPRRSSSIRTVPPPCSSAFWKSSLKTSASAVARSPASETGSSSASTVLPATRPCTSIARSRSISSARSTSSSRCSVSTSWTAAIARIRLTESVRARRGSTSGARACSRSSDATVWRLFLTRWWISWASTPRITARPCSSATAAWWAIASSSAAVLVRERRVAVADELADLPPLPAQRQPHVVGAGAALRPRDLAVLEHERGAGRVDGRDRRLHDRLERLLQVERLGDGLRDLRQRLELVHAPLRVGVQARVLDRLGDLGRDRDEQVDLGLAVLARLARADVERAFELRPGRGSGRRGSTRTRPRAGSGRA